MSTEFDQILKEFFNHIEEGVKAREISSYSRLEELVIEIFLEWLLDNYYVSKIMCDEVTESDDQLYTNYTFEDFCKDFDNEPEPHE